MTKLAELEQLLEAAEAKVRDADLAYLRAATPADRAKAQIEYMTAARERHLLYAELRRVTHPLAR